VSATVRRHFVLIGIILNDGVRQPTVRLEELHLPPPRARNAPRAAPEASEQVMKPEVAAALRKALTSVVEDGTARRLKGAFSRPDKKAAPVVVGGKTGTRDNRHEIYGSDGSVRESRAVNRTATFAFFLGERYYGVITAYVPGAVADNYSFTSALPVQTLKTWRHSSRPCARGRSDAVPPQPAIHGVEPRASPQEKEPKRSFPRGGDPENELDCLISAFAEMTIGLAGTPRSARSQNSPVMTAAPAQTGEDVLVRRALRAAAGECGTQTVGKPSTSENNRSGANRLRWAGSRAWSRSCAY
jgi:membrane peptidoglycan carboxypeptidase